MDYYFYLLKPSIEVKDGMTLDEFISSLTETQKGILEEHFAYMEKLVKQKKILLGGPLLDAKGLVLILRVSSKDEAEQLISNEPTISSNLFQIAESHPMQIAISIQN
ncbi:MAG: YciI family protein [Candidatus Heimdallarchaeota archaeon]